MLRSATIIMLMLLMSACRAPEDQPDVPALLTNPGPETLQEIEHTVATALSGTTVTLAADVLTKTSVLVIERGMRPGIDRPPELGRDLGRPYHFKLVISGSECVLVDEQTTQHWPLAAVECIQE